MAVTVHHYPGCSTCKKALAWLRENKISFALVDLVATPPDAAELGRWHRASGKPLTAFFNTSGQSYRGGNFKERLASMSDKQMLEALAADGKLIRRPVLVVEKGGSTRVAVGFRPEEFEAALGRAT
jgi:arsenate reductase